MVLVSEPVRGRSRATELPCCLINMALINIGETIEIIYYIIMYYKCTCLYFTSVFSLIQTIKLPV